MGAPETAVTIGGAVMGVIYNATVGFMGLTMFVAALFAGELIWAMYSLSAAFWCFGAET